MNQSIFTNRNREAPAGLRDRIGYYHIELRVCESLMTMGYLYSNGVHLERRAKQLTEEIDSLERQLKLMERLNREEKHE